MTDRERHSKGRGPAAMTIARLRIIDSLLAEGKWYGASDLHRIALRRIESIDNSAEFSLRQVQQDLVTLEELCLREFPDEAEIYEYKGAYGRSPRRYRKGISLFTKRLSRNEKILLASLLPVTGPLIDHETLRQIDQLKAESMPAKETCDAIDIGIRAPEGDSFAALFNAIADGYSVRITYNTFHAEESKETVVIPRLLRQYNGRWFLMARVVADGFAVTFRLDQIKAVSPVADISPNDFDGSEEDRRIWRDVMKYMVGVTLPDGAISGEALQQVVVWISDESYPYFATKPLLDNDLCDEVADDSLLRIENPNLKGGHFITMECYVNYELKQNLMAYMDSLAVVSPRWLADEMRERVERMRDNYRGAEPERTPL